MAIEEKVVQPESNPVAEQKSATPEPPVDAIKKQYEEQIAQLQKKLSDNDNQWSEKFNELVHLHKEIVEVHRLTGSGADYLLKIVSPTIEAYDKFQQILITKIDFTSMSSSVSLHEIKYQTSFPLNLN